jgi:WD40 repeat protein
LKNIRSLAFSPSGTHLAAAGADGLLMVWNMEPGGRDGAPPRVLWSGMGAGRAAAFTSDGKVLISAFQGDDTVEFWDVGRLTGWQAVPSLPPEITDVALAPAGDWLATGHTTGVVRVRDRERRRPEHTFSLPAPVSQVAFSSDGTTLASVCLVSRAGVWDVASGKEILSLDAVKVLAFAPEGGLLATGSPDGTVRLFEIPSGVPRTTETISQGGCECLAFAPNGKTLAVGSDDGTVRLWDLSPGGHRVLIPNQGTAPVALAFTPDGRALATGSSDGEVRLWDAASGQLRATYSGHREPVHRLAFSPDGRTLASVGTGGAVKLWHRATGQELFALPTPGHLVLGLAFSPDGRELLVGSRSRHAGPSSLLVWPIATEESP